MIFKKIAIAGITAGLMLASAVPAFGYGNLYHHQNQSNSVTHEVTNNSNIENNVNADANSGFNVISSNRGGNITTGVARATADIYNAVNLGRDTMNPCGCITEDSCECAPRMEYESTTTNNSAIKNNANLYANTGENVITNSNSSYSRCHRNYTNGSSGSISTGEAVASGIVTNIVNTGVVDSE